MAKDEWSNLGLNFDNVAMDASTNTTTKSADESKKA